MPSILDLMAMVGLGFFGTGHCVGMCGPIVLAVPARAGRFLPQLTYHAGRVITYTVIGGLVGLVGSGFTWAGGSAPAALHHASDAPLGNLARAQILLSVVAALFLALFAALRIGLVREPRWMRGPSPTRLPGYDRVSKGAVQGRPMAMLLWGMMLGTLPCGLSYAAFARALPAGSAVRGGVLALAFGIGTMPGLLFLGTVGARFFAQHRKLSDLVSGALMGGMAVALAVGAAGACL